MKAVRNLVLGLLLSALFLWLAQRGLDWSRVETVLRSLRWGYAPILPLVWIGSLTCRSLRWRGLLNQPSSFRSVFHVYNVGLMVNSTIPFRAGDLARVYLISHQGVGRISGWAALGAILIERLLDMLAVVLLFAIVLLFLPVASAVVVAGMVLGGAGAAALMVLVIFSRRPRWALQLLGSVLQVLPLVRRLGAARQLQLLLDGLESLTTTRGFLRAVAWTGVAWLLSVLEVWILALLLPELPMTTSAAAGLALAVVAVSFSIIVPFTVANVGPFEAAVVFALGAVGVTQEAALTFALMWHAGVALNSVLWGLIGLVALGASPREIRQGLRAMRDGRGAGPQVIDH